MKDSADYVLTFEELAAMFKAQNVDPMEMADDVQDGSVYGKGFAQSGGVSGAVMEVLDEEGFEMPVTCRKCMGAKECKKSADCHERGENAGKYHRGHGLSRRLFGWPRRGGYSAKSGEKPFQAAAQGG